MGIVGNKKEESREEMRTETIMTEKKKDRKEERETAMAALGLVLLVAGAKHASASFVLQWRPLLVFLLLNLLLLAILFTSMRSNSSSNKNPEENKKKKKKIKMIKKKRSTSMTPSSSSSSSSWSSSSSSSVHQVLEDYFCKTSNQEIVTSNSLAEDEPEFKDIYEVGVEDRTTPTAHNHNLSTNNADNNRQQNTSEYNRQQKQQQQQQEDINARVEAFIVMFRQQLAVDALQSSRRRSESSFVSRRRSTDDQTQVSFDFRHKKGLIN